MQCYSCSGYDSSRAKPLCFTSFFSYFIFLVTKLQKKRLIALQPKLSTVFGLAWNELRVNFSEIRRGFFCGGPNSKSASAVTVPLFISYFGRAAITVCLVGQPNSSFFSFTYHDKLSVCLSVTFVDCGYTDWNSSKVISWMISLGTWLSRDPNIMDLLQGGHP